MKTHLDWSDYQNSGLGDAYADIPKTGGDFAKAIAVCINSQQCEKKDKGVMCPSFRVTDESMLSTGGRVKLLKKALNGELGPLPFTDPELHRIMKLCLACKGCKRECESEVDMAQIKIEYLAQLHEELGTPVRAKLFGNVSSLLDKYPLVSTLIRSRNRQPWLAKLGETFLGISATRRLPEPSTARYSRADIATSTRNNDDAKQEVVLFIDTFTRFYEPQNAQAAINVLVAAGYHVYIADIALDDSERPLCCGRSMLGNGLVSQAKQEAERTLSALLPHAAAGRPILGLEPSCLLAIRDDYRSLGLGEEAELVAQSAILFEEFMAKESTAKRIKLNFNSLNDNKPILVHGHCHQKAVGAMKAMRKVLKLLPNTQFQLIESTCCGMAGSFGIEAEHADISKQMAELSLLPAIRQQPDAHVIANGFSCRHQIKDGCNHQAMHIAVLLEKSLMATKEPGL